jgi:CheY-like chemotaxis protein
MELLKKWGMRVIQAENGQEAVLLVKTYRPDIIIMDLRMPVMDGYQALEEIRKNPDLAGIPAIALTASADPRSREHIINAGFNEYLTKPIDSSLLIEEIARLIDRPGPAHADDESTEQMKQQAPPIDRHSALKLLADMDREIMPQIAGQNGTIIMSKTEGIAAMIENTGRVHGVPELIQLGRDMKQCTDIVDLQGLRAAMTAVEKFHRALQMMKDRPDT